MGPTGTSLGAILADLAERVPASPDAWERIESRGRQRDRRRRAVAAATLSVAVAAAAAAGWSRIRHAPPATDISVQAPISVAPLGGWPSNQAAWVSGGQLWLLDGTGPAHPVAASAGASAPAWSHDGQWVSYLRGQGGATMELRVVRSDGSGNRRLWTGKLGGFAWSPTSDEVALSAAPAVGAGGLLVATAEGILRRVVTDAVEVNSFAWSPDGESIAYAEVHAPAASYRSPLKILTVHGEGSGTETTVYRTTPGDGMVIGGWWPDGHGLLLWAEPQYSKAIEAEGLPLVSFALAGGAPLSMTTTLVSLPWLAWSPDKHHVLVVSGAGHLPSENKNVALCTIGTGGCTPLPIPADTVSLDPAWSPDGQQVAFVVAARSEAATAQWYASRRLWVVAAGDLGRAHPVAGATAGAATPSWSPDGATIRYTTRLGVESIAAGGGRPQVLSGNSALTGTPGLDGPTAYGKVGWTGHAVWSTGSS